MAATADHTAEIAHDEHLYDLLAAVTDADEHIRRAADKVLASASVAYIGFDNTGTRTTGRNERVARDDLAVGDVYWQANTWTRGEGDRYRIVTAPAKGNAPAASRQANVDDAVDSGRADADLVAAYHAAIDARGEAMRTVEVHEADGYTGWDRYFLVVSSAGHVHRGMRCSTCNPATAYRPVVSLSGSTEAEAVAMLGETLCTVCYPSAPVDGQKITAAKARKLAKVQR